MKYHHNLFEAAKKLKTKLKALSVVVSTSIVATVAALALTLAPVGASTLFSNGFETDTNGWFTPTRVATGTNGIPSATGSWHAQAATDFTQWGGYNYGAGNAVATAFQEYTTSVDVYLNVGGGWANNTRFDFSSAINNAAGTHLSDFIFNGGFYNDATGPGAGTDRFVVSASFNSQPGSAFAKNPGFDPIAISTTGWYTFEHHFYENAGVLNVDMSIFDASHTLVKTWTRVSAPIAGVGGNRYGWFDFNEFSTLAFDNSELRVGPDTPPTVKVTIDKYIDNDQATVLSANNSSFPMQSSWDADNIGAGSGTYTLGPVGFNSPNPYEAVTSDMSVGADYTTNEVTGGPVVGATCTPGGAPYALVGYSTGDTLAAAEAAGPSATIPAFTDLQNDKFVIVWNETCPTTITPSLAQFCDVRRPNDINVGPDLGGTGHQAMNFTGSTGSAGDSWVTLFNEDAPVCNGDKNTYESVNLDGDVLIHPYNNRKGGGLVALYNEGTGNKGLALIAYDNGNTDALVLASVNHTTGKVTNLVSVPLGSGIAENQWYHVSMDVTVTGPNVTVTGNVFRHSVPSNPNSPLGLQVGGNLNSTQVLSTIGVAPSGQVGMVASAISAVVDTSITNFTIAP